MILVARQPFTVSAYHAELHPDASKHEMGPVLRVGVRFRQWLKGREVEADAFLDPGADVTVLSARWVATLAEQCAPATDLQLDGDFIDEDVTVSIGGHPSSCRRPSSVRSSGPNQDSWRATRTSSSGATFSRRTASWW